MKFLRDFDFNGKKVILRAGFDMPLDKNGQISDDTRIKETLPTIKYLLETGCKQLIIVSHMGRPKEKIVETLKNNVVAKKLEELIGQEVVKLDECADAVIPDGKKIVMLENLRFYSDEEANGEEFSKKIAEKGNIYVNDAFSVMHREHASIVGIPKYIPACAGMLVEKELNALKLENAEKPIIGILGGSKISTKFGLIQEMLKNVDRLLLGGAMVFTFYRAKGYEIGKSLFEHDQLETAKLLSNNEKIVLPTDIVVAKAESIEYLGDNPEMKTVLPSKIEPGFIGLDLGQDTVDEFELAMKEAKTVVWNGPLGYFENLKFAEATKKIGNYLVNSGKKVVIGGGDTVAAIEKLGIQKEKYYHVSTGGGASMELLAGSVLPGIKALNDNEVEFF